MAHKKINVGDQVAHSIKFLTSIGERYSDTSRDRGIVKSLVPFGELTLVEIDWRGNSPPKVIEANLVIVQPQDSRFWKLRSKMGW